MRGGKLKMIHHQCPQVEADISGVIAHNRRIVT